MLKKLLLGSIVLLTACSSAGQPQEMAEKLDELYKNTVEAFEQKIVQAADKEKAKLDLAEFYYQKKEYSKALLVLQDLKTENARIQKAKLYVKSADYTRALELYDRLKDLKDNEALFLYAYAQEKKNLFPQAKEKYKALLRTDYAEKAQKRLEVLQSKKIEISERTKSLIEKKIDQADYPDADSVVIYSEESIDVSADNTSVYTVYALVKILNERGRNRWAELNLSYDSTYQRVELDYARTITPDHQVITVGTENIRDVNRYMNFPMYSNSKAFIISMPQVTKGSYIEYKARIHKSKLINEDDSSVIYRLFESFPVVESSITFSFPKERELTMAQINKEYLPEDISFDLEKSETKYKDVYTYKFKDIAQFIPESNMPNATYVNPALVVSTFESWQELYEWWKSLYEDKLVMTEEMKSLVDELKSQAKDSEDLKRLIYEFCSRRIRYVAIEYGDAGFEPHSSDEVFFNRYGDCKDQAILLVTLLRHAGFKAYPVLIPTDDAFDLREDIVASYFNHAIAAVEDRDGNLIFMDPTSSTAAFGTLPLGDQDRKTLVFYEEGYKIEKTPLQASNELFLQMQITLDEDEKAKIKRRLEYKGFYAAAYRNYYKNTPPSLVKDSLLRKARSMSSLAELETMDIKNIETFDVDPILEYSFSAPNFLSNAQDLRVVPILSEDPMDASYIDKDQRAFPLDLKGLYTLKTDIALLLPDNLEVVYMPDDLLLEMGWGTYSIKLDKVYNTISFKERLEIKEKIIDRDDYLSFKNELEEILYKSKKQIILRKVKR